jgi:hypothetical protein
LSRRRTELTGAIAAIRHALTEEEREILILHVDRRLDWDDLAVTSLGEDASRADVSSEAKFLRERMNAILERVERVAVQHRIVRPR